MKAPTTGLPSGRFLRNTELGATFPRRTGLEWEEELGDNTEEEEEDETDAAPDDDDEEESESPL